MKIFPLPLLVGLVCALNLGNVFAAPTITATQDDATAAATRKAVGDTITYTTTINNTAAVIVGSTVNDATAVLLTNPTPANTTDSGVVAISPVAFDDTYPQTVIGNVSINSANIPYSVVTNDPQGQNGGAVTITAFDATTAAGGQVVMTTSGASIGRFTYNPPPGFEGTDTFTYTLANSVGSSVGTVRIPVSGMVWFINSSAPACTTLAAGCGRLSNPFSTMAAFAGLNNGTGNNPAAGDNIFLFSGSYASGLTLLGTQRLIGQGAVTSLATITGLTVPSGSTALPATGGTRPTIAVTSGTGVTLASGNTVNGLNVTNTAGSGITGSAVGTLTLADFDVTVTNGSALSLITSGTVTATGTNNDLASTTGVALNVANVTIGAGGMTFKSVAASGAASGIVLATTGAGALTVTGDGGAANNGSGGVIQNTTGPGINLSSAGPINLGYMNVTASGDDGIRGATLASFTLNRCNITNNGNAVGERGLDLTQISGSGGISNCTISGSAEHNVILANDTANLTAFNVTGTTISTTSFVTGDDGFQVLDTGSASMTVSVTGCTFTDNKGDHFQAATDADATGPMNITFNNNILTTTAAHDNNDANMVIGGGITINTSGSTDIVFQINNNNLQQAFDDAININLDPGSQPGASMTGTISGNTIGTSGVAASGCESSNTITVAGKGAGLVHIDILNNQIFEWGNQYGIFLAISERNALGNPSMIAKVTGNTLHATQPNVLLINGIHVAAGATANGGAIPPDGGTLEVVLTGNDVTGEGNVANADADIRLRQRFSTTIKLPGYAGANNDTAAVNAFVSANNDPAGATPAPTVSSVQNVGGGGGGYIGGAVTPLLFAPKEIASLGLGTPDSAASAIAWSEAARAREEKKTDSTQASAAARETSRPLTQTELDGLVATARERWAATGATEEQMATLRRLQFEVADLPGWYLGEAAGDRIRVDTDAGGNGWSIDASTESRGVDLLTTIMHEMGHALGLSDTYLEKDRANVMYGFLSKGERRLPAKGQAMGAMPNEKSGPHFLASPVNLGTLPPGKSVKVAYSVTVGPITGNPQSVSSQAVISGGGFSNVNAVDAVAGSGPTVTLVAIPPTFTSANATTFTTGTLGSFSVTANGAPAATFSFTGSLPSGVTLTAAGVLSGTPAAGTGGTYPITITANNGIAPNATQSFTLTVNQPPAITSTNAATFVVGTNGSFTVTKTGFPAPTLSQTGTLPNGVTFTAATGVLGGTPAAGTGGTYPISFKAANGVGSDAVQSFTLTVNQAPAITSVNTTTFTVGTAGNFNVIATGFPSPTINLTGTLPGGVNFGTGTLAGTPTAFGTFPLTFTASNGVGSNAVQSFSLVVNPSASAVKSGGNIAKDPGGYKINFLGNPGTQYTVQFSPSLVTPNWQTLELKIADPQGTFFSIDNPPVGTTPRFYRAIIP